MGAREVASIKRKLKKNNLPSTLFDEDFEQRYQAAVALHAELAVRMEELENSPEWRDKDLPWRVEREQYKAALAAGQIELFVPGIEVVQDVRPKWVNLVDELEKMYRWLDLRPSRHKPGYAPLPGSHRERMLKNAGVDVEQLRAEKHRRTLR